MAQVSGQLVGRASELAVIDRVLNEVEPARVAAASLPLPTAHAFADLAHAAVELDLGFAAAAADRAVAAALVFESVSALFHAAQARCLAGRALVQAGDFERAIVQLEQAASAFDSFGSFRYRDQAERELRKLGRHVSHRTRPGAGDGVGVSSLTERELQVARLVVDRRTNNEIAAELFLSEKTVETHMRNIFNKLGVAHRVAVARAVEQADRAASSG